MSHDIHQGNYSDYDDLCPDCNGAWFRAVRELLGFHFAVYQSGILVCDKCNKPGGGDVLWPCNTANIIRSAVGPELIDMLEGQIHGHQRPGTSTGGSDPIPEGATDTDRRPEPVRALSGPETWLERGRMSGGLQAPLVPLTQAGSEDSPGLPPMGSLPQLRRCHQRRRPSSVEKCKKYLFFSMNYWICTEHGPQNGYIL